MDGLLVSYGQLPHLLGGMQQWVSSLGVPSGSVLCVALPNHVDTVLVLLGACLHATLTPVDPELGAEELYAITAHVGATGVITDVAHAEGYVRALSPRGIKVFVAPLVDELLRKAEFGHTGTDFLAPPLDHVHLLQRTSGTTGTSKRVPLRALQIGTQAWNTAESLHLSDQDRIVQVMPLFHMHGFGCLTGTLWSGGTVICAPGHRAEQYAEWLRIFRPTWFSATPTILQDVKRIHTEQPALNTIAPYRFIRSLSAPITLSLLEELMAATGAPVVEQYGLTEALSPVIANEPPPGLHRPGTLGKAFRNEVSIVNEAGTEVTHGEIGEIVLRGAGVIKAYAESDAVNARSWFGDRFRTGDLGFVDAEGFVHLTGRLKEEINRGGEKISPLEVEAALEGHPAVSAVAAFGVPHPTLGEEVALACVPANGALEEADLRAWMQRRLAPQKVPKLFFAMDALPTTATGKVKRTELARQFTARNTGSGELSEQRHTEPYDRAVAQAYTVGRPPHEGAAPETLPADYVERTVAMVWGQELGLERVLLTDDFFLIGGDSLSGLRICSRLKDMLGCDVVLGDLFRHPVLHAFASSLSRMDHVQRWSNLTPIRLSGGALPFICVHADEGNYTLPRLMDKDRPFIGFMHQGEDGSGMRYQTIKSMARHYVSELLEARPEGPYILAGFSTGGVVAYEMAQRLQAMGRSVPLLVLFDARGPKFQWWRYATRTKISDLRGDLLRPRCERYLEKGLPIPYKLRNFYIINTYRRALERYRPMPYGGPVLLVRSEQRSHEPAGWDGLLNGNLTTTVVRGEHLTILREPHVHAVAAALEQVLRERGL